MINAFRARVPISAVLAVLSTVAMVPAADTAASRGLPARVGGGGGRAAAQLGEPRALRERSP